MRINTKLITGLMILIGGLGLSIALTIHIFLLPQVQKIEQDSLLKDLERVAQAIDVDMAKLSAFAQDWGIWDDTYRYVDDRNLRFAESNLHSDPLPEIDADLLAIVTLEGEVLNLITEIPVSLQGQPLDQRYWAPDHPFL